MPLRSDWSEDRCPIARCLQTLGDPWALLVLREVLLGNDRFDGLRDGLGVADNTLSSRLQALVADGVLTREPYRDGGRTRYAYRVTPAGEDALPVLNALARWSVKHSPPASPDTVMSIRCARCGEDPGSADWCTTCAEPLTAATTRWSRASAPGVLIPLVTASGPSPRP